MTALTGPAAPLQSPFSFAIRTTAAALMALASAQLLGIHHPWWAAMTVWLVAQPTRSLLLERSLARLAGTVCGAIVGALILVLSAQHLPIALIALAFWLALCAGLGTTFRHFRNYGLVLAGYTTGIVVLFELGAGHADTLLAWDRVLCTLIGILCSALLSFRALPSQDFAIQEKARSILESVLRHVASRRGEDGSDLDSALLAQIGAFDRGIDERTAGTIRRRAETLRLRHISGVLLEIIALSRSGHGSVTQTTIPVNDPLQCTRHLARNAAENGQPALGRALEDLATALEPSARSAWSLFRFDFDAVAAFRAAARPVLALAIAATLWLTTGWQVGAMMAMTAALFTSLFSSHTNGSHMVGQVMLGTLAGATLGLGVRLFLLPHAEGLLATLICIAPFLLVFAWLMRQPATAKMAIDMAMTLLLTAQPGTAPVTIGVALPETAAIVSGAAIAMAIFWIVLPSTPAVNRDLLARRIAGLTARIAGAGRRQQLRHEALRSAQVRLLDVTPADSPLFQAAQTCLAAAAEVRSLNSISAQEKAVRASTIIGSIINSKNKG